MNKSSANCIAKEFQVERCYKRASGNRASTSLDRSALEKTIEFETNCLAMYYQCDLSRSTN
jgi:hypothetical protein